MIAKQSTFKKFVFSESKWTIVICEIKEAFAGFRWPRSHLKCQLSGHLAKNEILYCFNLDSSTKISLESWLNLSREKWSRNIVDQAPGTGHFRFWLELKRPSNIGYSLELKRSFNFIYTFQLETVHFRLLIWAQMTVYICLLIWDSKTVHFQVFIWTEFW